MWLLCTRVVQSTHNTRKPNASMFLLQQLRQTEQALRETQRALEDEKNAHNTTRRILADTQAQLEATEAARAALEEANNQCQSDLAFTKEMLARMTDERDQVK